MVTLALDYGESRIGVAITDPLGAAAHGLPAIEARPREAALEAIARLVEEREVDRIVVGLPVSMDGSEGPQARKVRGFIKRLRRRLPRTPVETVDERLTSARAHRALSAEGVSMEERQRRVDSMAAQFILRRYLSRREAGQEGPGEG